MLCGELLLVDWVLVSFGTRSGSYLWSAKAARAMAPAKSQLPYGRMDPSAFGGTLRVGDGVIEGDLAAVCDVGAAAGGGMGMYIGGVRRYRGIQL